METVSISVFRANLLKYMKKVQQGEPLAITSNGEVMATVAPPVNQRKHARSELNRLSKSAVIHDVVSPTDERWDAAQ
jgi:prevent-host-death family protein